jgi:hypothetical protein
MSPQTVRVLSLLNAASSGRSTWGIWFDTDIPQASVRRSIQELRKAGKKIVFEGGLYKLKRR